jgi:hypothetical protein
MKRFIALSAALLLVAWGLPPTVQAQTSTAVANYAAGWNMIAGPTGADFSAAGTLYAYTSSGYVPASSSKAVACQGYWAFFTDATTVTFSDSSGSVSQSCPLQAGWNLIGNPFAGGALLPAGVTAYHWNPDTERYDIVQVIPPGAAVWINVPAAGSILLQIVAETTPASSELTISDLTSPGPYRVHVGDTVKLILASAIGYTANANPAYLHLESAGFSGPLSCIGEPSCVLSLVNQFWIWRALQPGATVVSVAQVCASAPTPCGGTMQQIQIEIQP